MTFWSSMKIIKAGMVVLFLMLSTLTYPVTGFFSLENNTGFTIYWIYVVDSSADEGAIDWGDDRLGRNVLLQGEVFTFSTEEFTKNSIIHVRVIDEDLDTYTFYDLDLQEIHHLRLTLDDLDKRRQ